MSAGLDTSPLAALGRIAHRAADPQAGLDLAPSRRSPFEPVVPEPAEDLLPTEAPLQDVGAILVPARVAHPQPQRAADAPAADLRLEAPQRRSAAWNDVAAAPEAAPLAPPSAPVARAALAPAPQRRALPRPPGGADATPLAPRGSERAHPALRDGDPADRDVAVGPVGRSEAASPAALTPRMRPPLPIETPSRRADAEPPRIEVTIGRIEVRPPPSTVAQPAPARREAPARSLQHYLARRSRGDRS